MANVPTRCQNKRMLKKPLIETNLYLRDSEKYRKTLVTNVSSSTEVETGATVESVERLLNETAKTGQVKKPQGSTQ